MAAKALSMVNPLYYMPKPNIFSRGVPSRLPEAYKKFYEEWTGPPTIPVHYQPEQGKWKRNPETGEVWPVQDVPLRVLYPKNIHTGIWGGEGAILGFKKQRKYVQRTTRWWMPTLHRSVVYSEILDKRLSVIVTKRTVHLITQHQGFDKYILETSTPDLRSLLALKLKKLMLLALFDKTLYPDDSIKQEEIYNKYKHHLTNYNKDDLQWFALSIGEAVAKLLDLESSKQPTPLKHLYRVELIEELKDISLNDDLDKFMDDKKDNSKSWLNRVNPFSKTT